MYGISLKNKKNEYEWRDGAEDKNDGNLIWMELSYLQHIVMFNYFLFFNTFAQQQRRIVQISNLLNKSTKIEISFFAYFAVKCYVILETNASSGGNLCNIYAIIQRSACFGKGYKEILKKESFVSK